MGGSVDVLQRASVQQEALRMVLLHTRLGTVAASLFAVLLAVHLAHYSGLQPGQVYAWLAVKLVVAAARIGLALRYRHVADAPGTNRDRWRHALLALLALDGLVWGLGGWRVMAEPVPLVAVVVAALDGVSCVATFGLQASLAATAAYTVPILLPLAVGLAWRGDEIALFTALGQLILLLVQLSTARASAQRLATGVLLRLQAQTLAQQKDEALRQVQQQSALRSQFLAKVSHELRTPLHGMLGMTRLLHLDATQPLVARRLELIEGSGTHLLGLINDLLDVARIDSDHFALHDEEFDLVALLQQVAEVFAMRASDKGLLLHTRFDSLPQPCWVRGDSARVRQVLNNLLGNAVKFTRQGHITLVAGPDTASGLMRFEVQDTGEGIHGEQRARIFQPFHQVADGPQRATEGVGLGLTIASELAIAMGGRLSLLPEPASGTGTTFVFTARLPAVAGPSQGGDGRRRLPGLVLVAEDDEINAMIVGAFLDSLGVRFERVGDGRQAVARALRETGRPELVLMDLRMPVMDGPTATREIRRQEHTLGLPRLPIVALTATSTDEDRQTCLSAGMDEVVGKPFTRAELERALREAGPPRPASAAPTAPALAPPAAAGPGARSRP